MTRKALVVFGTRPEAIKVAPIVAALAEHPSFEPVVCVTAQHREMLDEVLSIFGIDPHYDLDIMTQGQSLTDISVRALSGLAPVIEETSPDLLVVQGDTSTTLMGALSAFYHRVPIAHVEAGYRTADLHQPFPEEANRRLVSEIADWHFAVNEGCRENLLREGHDGARIRVVGNTGIDALMEVQRRSDAVASPAVVDLLHSGRRTILMTMHRRENWGEPIRSVCLAARRIASRRSDAQILFALHPNPVVQQTANEILGAVDNVHLMPALDYVSFSKVLGHADIVMSDSGGVHEEALALGKPLLLLRNVSEWPEAVRSGQTRLVGTDAGVIEEAAVGLLRSMDTGEPLPRLANPLADGQASVRVVEALDELMS